MSVRTIPSRHQQKIDTKNNWTSNNPKLLLGEIGIESDTGLFKIGNGNSLWNSLPYSDAHKLDRTGNASDVTSSFTQSGSRVNISTGEKISISFGKIMKWFSDLGTLAFKSLVAKTDLDASLKTEIEGKAPLSHVGSSGASQHPLGNGSAAGFSTNDYTSTEKTKLAGIATGANATTVENVLTSTSTTNALSAAQGKALQDGKAPISHIGSTGITQHPLGNGTNPGFSTNDYTSTEKTKLSGIAAGANATTVENVLTSTSTTNALSAAQGKALQDGKAPSSHVGASGVSQHPLGNGANPGFSTNDYTTSEKTKLSGIATGATATIVENVLTSSSTSNALSAAQGKYLNDNKASKPTQYTYTVEPTAWVGSASPYTATISVSNLPVNATAIVALSDSATPEQRSACRDAIMSPTSSGVANQLKLISDGEKPSIPLPIILTVFA